MQESELQTEPNSAGARVPERSGPTSDSTPGLRSRLDADGVDVAEQVSLLGRIAAEDALALSEFYDRTASLLFNVSFRILGDAHDSEEVIQDVFVQIWNKAADFDATLGAPIHWALRIARNRSIDRLRSRRRAAQLREQLQNLSAAESSPPSASCRPALAEDEQATVRLMVGKLPADQRRVLELAFFDRHSHAEIAGMIGEPLGTVKARIRRAMLRLRDTLGAYV